ncbi:MAG: SH3 domain-containing protein [Clostridia bacterium]|nr:SH3 domain-containing protein [Clostridia bacterium]
MKRFLAILLTVLLLAAVVPATSFAAGPVANGTNPVHQLKRGYTSLNLRTGAGTSYRSIGYVYRYTPFVVLQKKSSGWYKIRTIQNRVGWIYYKGYCQAKAYAKVNTRETGLNVRKTPNGTILGSVPKGKQVTVTKVNGQWVYLTYGKLKGWSFWSYLKFI